MPVDVATADHVVARCSRSIRPSAGRRRAVAMHPRCQRSGVPVAGPYLSEKSPRVAGRYAAGDAWRTRLAAPGHCDGSDAACGPIRPEAPWRILDSRACVRNCPAGRQVVARSGVRRALPRRPSGGACAARCPRIRAARVWLPLGVLEHLLDVAVDHLVERTQEPVGDSRRPRRPPRRSLGGSDLGRDHADGSRAAPRARPRSPARARCRARSSASSSARASAENARRGLARARCRTCAGSARPGSGCPRGARAAAAARCVDDVEPVVEVLAEASRCAPCRSRSWCVAATRRTSTSISSLPPTGLIRCSWSTRSSLACSGSDRSPISSRNSVPWCASSNRPRRVRGGAGEGAAHVAEQLALEQALGDRRDVDRHEAPLGARAAAVERARHQLLAGAALAEDQDAGAAGGDPRHGLEDLEHLRRLAGDVVEVGAGVPRPGCRSDAARRGASRSRARSSAPRASSAGGLAR